ncbi:MAG: CDP-glucose 4,6-dehydratase [Candidatus Omnitrophica bacterium]|nr:CDP-glucose 4,6-dehydratase [Candidatus Omnitrophota bacterium]
MRQLNIYKGKKVLVTGHTGFKGSWLSIWLTGLGANVTGFSLQDWENDYLFKKARLSGRLSDERGDISDLKRLGEVFALHKPDIVFHLAAQPLVRDSYRDPVKTFLTNTMGTVNILECIRSSAHAVSGVIITTDKCYKNREQSIGYKETDVLGGHDPYSASKAAAELVIDSYRNSFFADSGKLVASARAGNNLGGGDNSKDRIMPDCIYALKEGRAIAVRNPDSTRPWQHVLEPLYGYMLLGYGLLCGKAIFADSWNFGPEKGSIVPVSNITDLVVKYWGSGRWIDSHDPDSPHEAKLLSLDISKAETILGWKPKWNIEKTVKMTVDWYRNVDKCDAYRLCMDQIEEYVDAGKEND